MIIYIPTRGRPDKQITLKSIPEHWHNRVALVTSKEEWRDLKRAVGNVTVLADSTGCLSDRRQHIDRKSVV